MLRAGGSAGGAAPMGARQGLARGHGVCLLSPAGSGMEGREEASDTDSGIMLHSGEQGGAGGVGKGVLLPGVRWVPPPATRGTAVV